MSARPVSSCVGSNVTMQDVGTRAARSSRDALSNPKDTHMKSIHLTPVACAVLLFGCAIANVAMQDVGTRAARSSRDALSNPKDTHMKSIHLTPVACAVLLFGCAIANAQTSKTPSDQSSTSPVSTQADTTKGNDVVGTTPT